MNRTTRNNLGAIDSIKRVFLLMDFPFPSIGRANGLTTRPKAISIEFELNFPVARATEPS
jgi:hypothetical protein